MVNIKVQVTRTKAVAHLFGQLTSGMVGVPVSFVFDASWDGLKKTAVFKAGGKIRDQINISDTVTVPWEVLTEPGKTLQIGLYGVSKDGDKVIPTIWAEVGRILSGADPSGDPSADPSLPVWEQYEKDIEAAINGILAIQAILIGIGGESV